MNETLNLTCLGITALVILVVFLSLKSNLAKHNKKAEATRGRYHAYASSDNQSRMIDSQHVYNWQEGDGAGITDDRYPKSPYLRGADEKAEAWKDWADRNGLKPFGTDYADAVDRENYVDKLHEDWNEAHPYTHPQTRPVNTDGSEDVMDTKDSSQNRKEWH